METAPTLHTAMKTVTTLKSYALSGLLAHAIEIEITVGSRDGWTILGFSETAIAAVRERVHHALINAGFSLPPQITITITPTRLSRVDSLYDVPIALGILLASEQIQRVHSLDGCLLLGELALDGRLRHTPGLLPVMMAAKAHGFTTAFVPAMNAPEAALARGITIYAGATLADLIHHLDGTHLMTPSSTEDVKQDDDHSGVGGCDMADIRGQNHVKRMLEVAATGRHSVLMSGPPGAGKTLLAHALGGIMPPLTAQEHCEITARYSLSGLLSSDRPVIHQRPFIAPSPTITYAQMVGSGRIPQHGQMVLAHGGILVLDDLAAFSDGVLRALREPMEEGTVTVWREHRPMVFPTRFLLVGTMKPCPCGFHNDPVQECRCSAREILQYLNRLKRFLQGLFDIHIDVPRLTYEQLTEVRPREHSAAIAAHVQSGQQRQLTRQSPIWNSQMGPAERDTFCRMDAPTERLLQAALRQLDFTARTTHQILCVARTIADLDGRESIIARDLAEAIQYRSRNHI
ncbi:MAG: YifB family Mg chelatase-like AAA ATPase [Ktedonobacteraceae bacterium]